MINSTTIDQLCNLLAYQQPQWDKIKVQYENSVPFKAHNKLTIQRYAQEFSELHLDISLESIAQNELLNHLNQISSQKKFKFRNGLYTLSNNKRGRILISSSQGIQYEYDQIMKLDNIPLIFEIKLRKWDTGKIRKRKRKDGSIKIESNDSLKNKLSPEIYNKKLHPAIEFFGQDVGYIFIISNDQYYNVAANRADFKIPEFLQDNGKLVPFYTDRLTFREHVREKVQEFGYPLKEEPGQPSQQPKIYIL